ncbi:MAG: hypothetical protein AAFP97_05825 [Pseudomonadota bacterium]
MRSVVLPFALTLAFAVQATAQSGAPTDRHSAFDFQGRYIVSVQDADMLASAYVNGQLGPKEGRDTIAIIDLDGDPRDWTASESFASNSVASPPSIVDITPDGRFAVVSETMTERPAGNAAHTFADLSSGNRLQLFDLASGTPARPDAVRFSSNGQLLAVTFHPAGAGTETPLQIYRFENDRVGQSTSPDIPGWPLGERLIDVDWHPIDPVLAMIDTSGGAQVHFVQVNDDLSLSSMGNPVDIDRAPYRIEFTPNGRHVVINALYWGPDIAGTWIEAPVGSVVTVRLNA